MRQVLAAFLRTNNAGRAALLRHLIGPGPAWTVLIVAVMFWALVLTVGLRPPGMTEPLMAMLWMYAALGTVIATLLLVPAAVAVIVLRYRRGTGKIPHASERS